MKYRAFIEDNFYIDDPKTGKLVPLKFRPVQNKYYEQLIADYDIERKGASVDVAMREMIVKARKQGFSSLILAIFAADDLLQKDATTTQVISYKDDATKSFRTRYKIYVKSWYLIDQLGLDISKNAKQMIDSVQDKDVFQSWESGEYILKHNGAKFICGTASAKTGERGSTVHKMLLSEAAHYPDTEKMTATEIITGSSAQVAIDSGWIFNESTANGQGNFHHNSWNEATAGTSRYKARFFSWRDFYTEDQFELVKLEVRDPEMRKQEYPEFPEDAFIGSGNPFIQPSKIDALVSIQASKELVDWLVLEGTNYMDQCELIKDFLVTQEKLYEHRILYVGIDIAKSVDKTVVTVLRTNKLAERGGIKAIAIDSTGAGDFMPDWFERNARWYLLRVKFSQTTKSILYTNLQVVIEDKLTSLPVLIDNLQYVSDETEGFHKEMTSLQKKIIGRLLIANHPPGGHDDYADSWALAEYAYATLEGFPKTNQQDKEVTTDTSIQSSIRSVLNRERNAKPANTRYD